MSDRPEVSFVVVAWRSRDDVLRCLASIERHAGLGHETIVVDDGSGDGTPEAVRERFPNVHLVAKERNEGLSRGRNSALPLVRGRKVFMLDADTELKADAVATLVGVLDSRPEVGLVGPRLVNPDGSVQLSPRRDPPLLAPFMRRGPYARLVPDPASHARHMMKDFDHRTTRPVVWVMGAAQMWRSDLPALIGSYDERVSSYGGEDMDWCLRIWAAGLQVVYVAEAEVEHAWQQMTRRKQFGRKSFRALRDFYYLQWKHRRLRGDARLVEARS